MEASFLGAAAGQSQPTSPARRCCRAPISPASPRCTISRRAGRAACIGDCRSPSSKRRRKRRTISISISATSATSWSPVRPARARRLCLTFLLAQAFRIRPEPKAVFFDKDRGAEIFVRAVGGAYEVLQPGMPTGFNPLQLENKSTNRDFLLRLLKAMLQPADGAALPGGRRHARNAPLRASARSRSSSERWPICPAC